MNRPVLCASAPKDTGCRHHQAIDGRLMRKSVSGEPAPIQLTAWRSDLRYIAYYLVMPNAIFWVFAPFIYFIRPLVVVDYIVVCVFSPFLARRTVLVLLCLLFVVDVGFSLAPGYHLSGADFARNAHAVFFMSWPVGLFIVAILIAGAICYFFLFQDVLTHSSRIASRQIAVVCICAVLVLGLDIVNGSNIYIPIRWQLVNRNIAGGNLHKIALAVANAATTDASRAYVNSEQPFSRCAGYFA